MFWIKLVKRFVDLNFVYSFMTFEYLFLAFPLVKCTDQLTQLNIDINFNINGRIDRTVGWIRDKLDFMPHLEPLLLVLKLFLAQRGLNNPYTGGLPSYALVVMLVHYLEVFFLFGFSIADYNFSVYSFKKQIRCFS